MPTYIIKAPNGQDVEMTSDNPPTDAQKMAVFRQAGLDAAPLKLAPERTWTDTAVDLLPTAGGLAGGAIGGAGGAAFGVGFGGVPGAAGGAALGAGAGEAARQLINRLRGTEAPATSGEAAADIALPAIEAGATTAALGGAAKLAGPVSRALVGGASKAAGVIDPDLVGLWSPRAGNAIRVLNKAGAALTKPAVQAAAEEIAPKINITATDFTRIKALVSQGISESDAVKTVLNLKAKAMR